MYVHDDTKISTIRARRVQFGMERVRQPVQGDHGTARKGTNDTDTIWGVYPMKSNPKDKEYPVLVFTERYPDGLHFGPGEKIRVVADA